ncbi:MAG: Na+/H+ antiporter [Bacteroidales bacterium]|jgi:CPA1 family monovalent cation:H+ antiporter|nr:Na+/H+ antiporter [Bacteroidales bacterium]
MITFEYILILLIAILLSNLINRFLPAVSVPIIQIILGIIISFVPFGFNIELNPDLFFVLFIAPLVYNTSMLLDKRMFWSLKMPILNMAVILVLITVLGVGYLVHFMIPTLPLAVAFMLIGALGPTDDVAIHSVSQKVPIPKKLMNMLTGESIINDATGIVCFQFALAAVVMGSFSAAGATKQLLIVGIGGILVGLSFTIIKRQLVKWIRKLGMDNVTLHTLIEILPPFFVYLFAEKLGVSGILAVFAAGITQSFGKERIDPSTANLNIASKNIWNMLSFTLEGIVYLILGMQLPMVLQTFKNNTYSYSVGMLLLFVLIITVSFAIIRFVWFYLTTRKKSFFEKNEPIKKWKAALIFSLAGARGAVTMASVLSIPVLLSDGTAFPQRDLIILLSTGVILLSLIITNFILPVVVGKSDKSTKEIKENEACIEILCNVVDALEKSATKENEIAERMILSRYKHRIQNLRYTHTDKNKEKMLRNEAREWEKQNTILLIESGSIDEAVGNRYLYSINKHLKFPVLFSGKKRKKRFKHKFHDKEFHFEVLKLKEINDSFVIKKLIERQQYDNSYELKKVLSEYESNLLNMNNMIAMAGRRKDFAKIEIAMTEVASTAFQIERDNIQAMFESGRISREKAKELRNNLMYMEAELK